MVKNGTRISVVMATFQGAAYLRAQLDSLLRHLGPEDEIIISDDGSDDGTVAIIERIGDPRLRLLPPGPRLGYQQNFARAIAAASGQYLFFADQDDICLPMRIPLSLAALETAGCVCGDAVVTDADLTPLRQSFFADRRAAFNAWSLFLRPAAIGATMACRRDFLLENLPFPHEVPHDAWLSIRAARAERLAVIRQPVILYRRHPGAISATANRRHRAICAILAERVRLALALFMR